MPRSPNAQLAVDQFKVLQHKYRWTKSDAWKGIALLLLTCDKWEGGWKSFIDAVVYREVNDFKDFNAVVQRAGRLTSYLAAELKIPRERLCQEIGLYWKDPVVHNSQPNNLVGHAFRSISVAILEMLGDPSVTYEEEADPKKEFPGFAFQTRSKKPKIDILARRAGKAVALISARWRFRHDRVDVVDEALSYAPAARHQNSSCQLYALLGEFAPNRLDKVLVNCPPAHPNPALSATVHFAPQLILKGLAENGRLTHLRSLEWLIDQSFLWT